MRVRSFQAALVSCAFASALVSVMRSMSSSLHLIDEHFQGTTTTTSIPLMNHDYNGPRVVFERFNHSFPCYAPQKRDNTTRTQGLIYIRAPKTGSSTNAGVAVRLAHRLARKQEFDFCQVTGADRHYVTAARTLPLKHRDRQKSFLWTTLREPTSRLVSSFFHFMVSRRKMEPTDENFQQYVMGEGPNPYFLRGDYYLQDLTTQDPPTNNDTTTVRRILDDFDFIGVTERMDESLVALQMLLGVETADILTLSAKTSGGFDDGAYHKQCVYIVPPFKSPGMKEFFASAAWKSHIASSKLMYDAAVSSLDATIENLGRREFEAQLQQFRSAMKVVQARCAANITLPCSSGGKRLNRTSACFFGEDVGCGQECIDEVSNDLWPPHPQSVEVALM